MTQALGATKKRKNKHEWGVIAQSFNPYREFERCDLCGRFREPSKGKGYIKQSDIPRDARMPDSDISYWEAIA